MAKRMHWREAKSLLEAQISCIEKSDVPALNLLEGYVLVDLNEKKVFNCQQAFAIPEGWTVVE